MGELEDRLKRLAEHRAAQIQAFAMPPTDELAVRRRVARRDRRVVAIAACLVVALVLGGLLLFSRNSSGPTVETPAGLDPGVTDKTVKLGYISPQTGVGAQSKSAGKACQARIDRANAAGGVNGRKIEVEYRDDQSSAANLTAAEDLVQNRKVFAVVNDSPFAFVSYKYLQSQGVPMVGGGYDGTYYGEKGNEFVLSALGNAAPFLGLGYDNVTEIMHRLGGTKSAAIAYAVDQSGVASVDNTQNYAAPAQGLTPVYSNASVDFDTTDVGNVVLGIKDSGADAAYLGMLPSSDLAVLQGLQQNGVKLKAILMGVYEQDLLDARTASLMGPNTVLFSPYKPVEIGDEATKQFRSDLEKVGITGVPAGVYSGYIACDLAVTALEHAGKTPTRKGFVDGFRNLGTWDQAGLACQPVQVGLDTFGTSPATGCIYIVTVQDGKFVVGNNGKPVVGKLVGSPDALQANATGNPDLVTTTTAPSAP